MTTSGLTSFELNTIECIKIAFQLINVNDPTDQVDSEDYKTARMFLNMMLKTWQATENHLWVKQVATLFTQYNQNTYLVSPTTTDYVTTENIKETVLTASASLGETSLTVSSSAGFVVGQYIGVQQSNSYLFWTTINSIPSATSIVLNSGLTYAAASGNYIVSFGQKSAVPFQIYSGVRHDVISKLDTPLNLMSFREYQDTPNKTNLGTPTMFVEDRQLNYYNIYLWLTPGNVDYYIKFIISRKIQDVNLNSDTFDIPQEWMETIAYNLALRLAPVYGKAQGDNFAMIKAHADEALSLMHGLDNELGSIYIKPNPDGFRRP